MLLEEDEIKKENNVAPEMIEAVAKQLDSFINPSKLKNNITDASSYFSQTENMPVPKKEESSFKVQEPKTQSRPIVRTYRGDAEETIQTGHISSINIAVAENKRMLRQSKDAPDETKKDVMNKSILIVSLVLIVVGAFAFFIPKFFSQTKSEVKVAAVQTFASKPIMTVDLEEKINVIDVNQIRVNNSIREKITQVPIKLGVIKNIYFTEGKDLEEKLITSKKFLGLIKSSVTPEIQRTLKDSYMFGVHNYNGLQKFLILKVGSYDTTFSGMLKWEPNMWQDFKVLFDLPIDDSVPVDSYLVEVKKFQDLTFDNKDSRVVKDSSGKIVFLYSIIDEGTIVITTSKDTLREIVARISKARVITQ